MCDERDLRPDHPDQRLDGAGLIAISSISARIQETGGIAASIVAAVEQQGATTQEIVRNVAKAARGSGGRIAHIAGVAGAVEETGAAVSQVLGAAPGLSRQSERFAEQFAAELVRFLLTRLGWVLVPLARRAVPARGRR